MAYTEPRTWTDGEFVTGTIMNADIRDNFRAMGPHLIVRKPSDEGPVTNSTQQADDHLLLPVAANEIWHARFFILVVNTSGDPKFGFTFPSGSIVGGSITGIGAGQADHASVSSSTSPYTISLNLIGTSTTVATIIECVFSNGSTTGNLQLTWACATTGSTTVKANSTLWAVRLSP